MKRKTKVPYNLPFVSRPSVGAAYKCEKCGEIEFTEEQMRKALHKKENAIKTVVTRKIGKIGGSLVIRIPKSVENQMKLKSCKEVNLIVEKTRS